MIIAVLVVTYISIFFSLFFTSKGCDIEAHQDSFDSEDQTLEREHMQMLTHTHAAFTDPEALASAQSK